MLPGKAAGRKREPEETDIVRFWAIPLLLTAAVPVAAQELGLPAACEIGKDCFVQQFADMDAGPDYADPFCGKASYDGHDGLDLRVRSMKDMERGVPIVAVADGVVLRGRDGVADKLVASEQDRKAVADTECGNGLILDLGNGTEAQYCHLRQGSIVAKPGQQVKKGDRLGDIGASGMAEFPHVHLTVRRDGKSIDPFSGKQIGAGCDASGQGSLWSAEARAGLGQGETQLLGLGLAPGPIDHAALPASGPPDTPTTAAPNLVGWAWFINLQKGDTLGIAVTGPDGTPFANSTTEPMDRAKASYSAFAGKRGSPAPGEYTVTTTIMRDGKPMLEKTGKFVVK